MRRSALALALATLLCLPPAGSGAQTLPFPEIRVGESVRGALDPAGPSMLHEGRFTAYRFRGEEGRRYRADARSSEFDAYLILAHAVGGITEFLREDDDGGEGTDARLLFSVDRTGDYLLIVRAWGSEASGAFELSLQERELPPPAPPRALPIGESVSGRLTEESSIFLSEWDDEVHYDLWTFQGRGGQHYRISMASDDFDAYLSFGPISGEELIVQESDDDSGEGTNALLRVQLPHDGLFGIRTQALGSHSGLGAYTLRIDAYTPAPPVRRPVEAGAQVTARLGVDDAVLERGIHYQEWVYQGRSGERVRVRMRSGDFDSYLSLGREGPDGQYEELAWNDDAPDDGLNSLIEFTLPGEGPYLIRARSFSGGATGEYTLEVIREG
jgi:hypothetical protein